MDELARERVLAAVERVPAGRVTTYGDIARAVGATPRQVGAILRLSGGEVAWWRVVNASGNLPEHLLGLARALWDAEGICWDDRGVGLARHRLPLSDLRGDPFP